MRNMAKTTLPALAAASAALALILIVLSLVFTETRIGAMLSLLFLLVLVSMSLSLIAMAAQRKPTAQALPSVVTVISCLNCDYREEREYKVGDFVFKKLGSCARCGGELFISAIYAVRRAGEKRF